MKKQTKLSINEGIRVAKEGIEECWDDMEGHSMTQNNGEQMSVTISMPGKNISVTTDSAEEIGNILRLAGINVGDTLPAEQPGMQLAMPQSAPHAEEPEIVYVGAQSMGEEPGEAPHIEMEEPGEEVDEAFPTPASVAADQQRKATQDGSGGVKQGTKYGGSKSAEAPDAEFTASKYDQSTILDKEEDDEGMKESKRIRELAGMEDIEEAYMDVSNPYAAANKEIRNLAKQIAKEKFNATMTPSQSTQRSRATMAFTPVGARYMDEKLSDLVGQELAKQGYEYQVTPNGYLSVKVPQDVEEGYFSDLDTERKEKSYAKVRTDKPIGVRTADIGPGGKEHNVTTDAEWDKQHGVEEDYMDVSNPFAAANKAIRNLAKQIAKTKFNATMTPSQSTQRSRATMAFTPVGARYMDEKLSDLVGKELAKQGYEYQVTPGGYLSVKVPQDVEEDYMDVSNPFAAANKEIRNLAKQIAKEKFNATMTPSQSTQRSRATMAFTPVGQRYMDEKLSDLVGQELAKQGYEYQVTPNGYLSVKVQQDMSEGYMDVSNPYAAANKEIRNLAKQIAKTKFNATMTPSQSTQRSRATMAFTPVGARYMDEKLSDLVGKELAKQGYEYQVTPGGYLSVKVQQDMSEGAEEVDFDNVQFGEGMKESMRIRELAGVTEAQSPAQKAAFAAMIAKKNGNKENSAKDKAEDAAGEKKSGMTHAEWEASEEDKEEDKEVEESSIYGQGIYGESYARILELAGVAESKLMNSPSGTSMDEPRVYGSLPSRPGQGGGNKDYGQNRANQQGENPMGVQVPEAEATIAEAGFAKAMSEYRKFVAESIARKK